MMPPNESLPANALLEDYERDQRERAEAMMANWDHGKRRVAAWVLSLVWLSVGGQTIFPIGLVFALMMLLPEIYGWTLLRRLRYAGRRVLVLAAFALAGLLFVQSRLSIIDPSGSTITLRFHFKLVPWL